MHDFLNTPVTFGLVLTYFAVSVVYSFVKCIVVAYRRYPPTTEPT